MELSLGKPLRTLLGPDDKEEEDTMVARLKSSPQVVQMVYLESGAKYAEVVNRCLTWSPLKLGLEKKFEEKLFQEYCFLPTSSSWNRPCSFIIITASLFRVSPSVLGPSTNCSPSV